MSRDTCLVYYCYRQFECFGYLLRVFHSQQQREIVFFYFLLFLRGIDKRRNISFEGIHETRDDRFERVSTCHFPVQNVGRDRQMAIQRMAGGRYLKLFQEKAAGCCDEGQTVYRDVPLQVIYIVAGEVGVQG